MSDLTTDLALLMAATTNALLAVDSANTILRRIQERNPENSLSWAPSVGKRLHWTRVELLSARAQHPWSASRTPTTSATNNKTT